MTTHEQLAKSQKAFETHTRFYYQLPDDYLFPREEDGSYSFSYQFRDFERWQAAEEFARKQALEDAITKFDELGLQHLITPSPQDRLKELLK